MHRKRFKTFLTFTGCFLIIMSFLFLSGCGDKNNNSEVHIAYFPNITHSQALVMKHNQLLEKKLDDDCKLTWTDFNAGPAEVEALFSGDIDIGYIGPIPAISANVKSHGDVILIAGTADAGSMLLAAPDSGISTVDDLKGKTVAVPQIGNTQHLALLNLLAENQLKTTDAGGEVEIAATSNANILNLMQNKDVDAALVPEPWVSILRENCNAQIVLDEKEVWRDGDYPTAVVVVRKDFMEEHPDIVEKFLQAHQEATDYVNQNPDEAKNMISDEIEAATGKGIEKSVLDEAFKHLVITTDVNKDAVNAFAKISKQEGLIDSLPDQEFIQLQ